AASSYRPAVTWDFRRSTRASQSAPSTVTVLVSEVTVILKQRERSPREQARCDNFHRAPNEKRYGLILESDDDGNGQRGRWGRSTQQVWPTEVEYELHTTIRRDVLLSLRRLRTLRNPKALDRVL